MMSIHASSITSWQDENLTDDFVESNIKFVYDICLLKNIVSILDDTLLKSTVFDVWKYYSESGRTS